MMLEDSYTTWHALLFIVGHIACKAELVSGTGTALTPHKISETHCRRRYNMRWSAANSMVIKLLILPMLEENP